VSTCNDFVGVHKSTASRIVRLVSREIALLRPQFINFPKTGSEFEEVRQEFFNIARFPNCIGAIDCTHVQIISPGGTTAENYRNRKGYFSVNVQTVCDAQMRMQNIVARWPGSAHDSTIFLNSSVRRQFERGEMGDAVLVGDSGYGIRKYLMTPFENPQGVGENRYNEAQTRTRNPVERTYGLWKRRFPILARGIHVKLQSVQSIIVATAVLHNIARHFGEADHQVSRILERCITQGNTIAVPNVANEDAAGSSRRAALVAYFHGMDDEE